MADRVVSWKVVANFSQVRKEAESAQRAIDDLRHSEEARDKESQDRQRRRASTAKTAAAAGGRPGKDDKGGGYEKELKDLRAMNRALTSFSNKQKEVEKSSEGMSSALGKIGQSFAEYRQEITGINDSLSLLTRNTATAKRNLKSFDKDIKSHSTSLNTLRRHYDDLGGSVTKLGDSFAHLNSPLDSVLSRIRSVRDEARGLKELDDILSKTLSRTTALSRAEAERGVQRRRTAVQGAPKPDVDIQGAPKGGGKAGGKREKPGKSVGKAVSGVGIKKFAAIAAAVAPILTQLSTAVASVGAGLAGLASVAGYAASALAGLAPVATTAALGMGALFAAFSGVGTALGAYSKKQKNSTALQAKATKQAKTRRNAEEALAKQIKQNARDIEDAEDRVTDAYLGERRAQEALTKARKDATIQLRELREEVDSLALSEEEAALDLEDARKHLAETMADPGASQNQRRRAEIAVKRAEEALRDAKEERQAANEDLTMARDKGIEGSNEVVDATHAEYDANKELKRALEDLEQAHVDAGRAVRDLQDSMQEAKAAAIDPFADAMSKLPPIAQKLVNTIIALEPAWKKLKKAVADATLPGFITFFEEAINIMDDLQYALVQVGGAISDFMEDVTKLVTGGEWQSFYRFLGDQSAQIVDTAGAALLDYAEGLRYVFISVNSLTQALARLTAEWANNFKVTKEVNAVTGESIAFYDKARKSFEQFAEVVADLWSVLGALGKAFYGVGQELMNGIANMTSAWVIWTNSVEGQSAMQDWAEDLMPTLRALGYLVKVIIQELGELSTVGEGSSASFIYDIAHAVEGLSDVIKALAPLGEIIGSLIALFGDLFTVLSENGGASLAVIAGSLKVVLAIFEAILANPIGDFFLGLVVTLFSVGGALKVVGIAVGLLGKAVTLLGTQLLLLLRNPVVLLLTALVAVTKMLDGLAQSIAQAIIVIIALGVAMKNAGGLGMMFYKIVENIFLLFSRGKAGLVAFFTGTVEGFKRISTAAKFSFMTMGATSRAASIMMAAAWVTATAGLILIITLVTKVIEMLRKNADEAKKLSAAMGEYYYEQEDGLAKLDSIVQDATKTNEEYADSMSGATRTAAQNSDAVWDNMDAHSKTTAATYDSAAAARDAGVALTDEQAAAVDLYHTFEDSSVAVSENADMVKAASKAYDELKGDADAVGKILGGEYAKGTQESAQATLDLARAAGITRQELADMTPEEAALALNDYLESTIHLTKSERDLAEAVAVLNNKYSSLADTAEALNKYIDNLNGAVEEQITTALDAADSMDELKDSLKNVEDGTDLVKDGTVDLNRIMGKSKEIMDGNVLAAQDLNKEERELTQSLFDYKDTMGDVVAATYANTGSMEEALAAYAKMREELKQQLISWGMNETAAEEYLTTVLGIPPSLTTMVELKWGEMTPEEMQSALATMAAAGVAIPVNLRGADGSPPEAYVLQGIDNVTKVAQSASADNPIVITVNGENAEFFTSAESAQTYLDEHKDDELAIGIGMVDENGQPLTPTETQRIMKEQTGLDDQSKVEIKLSPEFEGAKADEQVGTWVANTEETLDKADTTVDVEIDKSLADEDIIEYLGQLNSIPTEKKTQIVAYVADAHRGVQAYVETLNKISERKETRIVAYVSDARKGIQDYLNLLAKIKPKYTSQIVAYVADAKKGVQGFLDVLNKIKPKYEIEIYIRNIQRATELVNNFRAVWDGLKSKTISLTVNYKETGAVPGAGAKTPAAGGGFVTYGEGGIVVSLSRASAEVIAMSHGEYNSYMPKFKYARGGKIRGPGGPRADKVPAWLSSGEYVVNASATSKFLPLLELINSNYAAGGQVAEPKGFAVGANVKDVPLGDASKALEDSVKDIDKPVEKWSDGMEDMSDSTEAMTVSVEKSFDEFVRTTESGMADSTAVTVRGLSALTSAASAGMNNYLNITKTTLGQVTQAWANAAVGIGAAWLPVQTKVSGPAKFVVQTVMNEGVIKSMNTLLKFLAQPEVATTSVKFRRGGTVPGAGNRDTVPAMLTPGEFVIKKSSVKKLGVNYLSGLNGYNEGGLVGGDSAGMPDMGSGFWSNPFIQKLASGGSVSGNNNARWVFNQLRGAGFTSAAASGVVGNLMQESGVNPKAKQGGGGPGRGIMQWTESQRWSSLKRWAAPRGMDPWALDTQYQYMTKEMKDMGIYSKLGGMTSTEGAVKYFHDTMERSADKSMSRRNSYAYEAYNAFGSGKPGDSTGLPSSEEHQGEPLDPNSPAVIFANGAAAGMKKLLEPTVTAAKTLTGSDYLKMLQAYSMKAIGLTEPWAAKKEKESGGVGGSLVGNAFASAGGGWPPQNFKGNAANTTAAIAFTKQQWPSVAGVGGWRAQGSVKGSDHPKGKAMDIMIPSYKSSSGRKLGNEIASWYVSNPKNFGTKYVIYYEQINKGSGWRSYSHPGGNDDSLAHRNHVHVSLLNRGGQARGMDRVPALLTPGEFVIPRNVASAIGPAGLAGLNRGKRLGYNRGGGVLGFHTGGPVGSFGSIGSSGRRFRGIKSQYPLYDMITQWTNDLTTQVRAKKFPTVWPSGISNQDNDWLKQIVSLLNAAAVAATAGTGGQSSYPGYVISRYKNSRNSNVKKIQAKVGVKQDGIFGPLTESAVKAWQRDKGLKKDGIVGQATWNSMFAPGAGTAGTAGGDKSVYDPAVMAAKLGIPLGTLLRIWTNGSEVITEGVQEANRSTFWDNMKKVEADYKGDLTELQQSLALPADGMWSVTMDEAVAHALYHGAGMEHDRWMARPWLPLTLVEEAIRETERANVLRKEWDGYIGKLYSWGLAYLVQDLRNKGQAEGMELAKSAVGNRAYAEELDELHRKSGLIKLEDITQEGYLPIWALTDFITKSDTPVGLREVSVRFGMPDYKAFRAVSDLEQSLREELPMNLLDKLFEDLQRFRTGTYYMSEGGLVPGAGRGDTVPTMLSPGEFVVKKEIAKALGLGFLDKLNAGASLADLIQLPAGLGVPAVKAGAVPNLERASTTTITTNNNFNTVINNPVAEGGSASLSRMLRQKAQLGVFGTTQEGA